MRWKSSLPALILALNSSLSPEDIDWLVLHQANVRIIDSMQKKLKMDSDKVIRTVARHANTSAASLPFITR